MLKTVFCYVNRLHGTFYRTYPFARYILNGASDLKLKEYGLTPKGRDGLLERPLELRAVDLGSTVAAAFCKTESLSLNSTIVACNAQKQFDVAASFESAAHEQYHAASLWGKSPAERLISGVKYPMIANLYAAVFIGCGFAFMPALDSSELLSVTAAAATIPTGLNIRNTRDRYQEEQRAYRFGATFNPLSYYDISLPINKKPDQRDLERFKTYPGRVEQTLIREHVRHENKEGSAFFPGGYNGFHKNYLDFLMTDNSPVETMKKYSAFLVNVEASIDQLYLRAGYDLS